MAKLTVDDLKAIREKTLQSRTLREGKGRARIVVHMGTCGIAAGARAVMAALLALAARLTSIPALPGPQTAEARAQTAR